jgi:hypothetical protein
MSKGSYQKGEVPASTPLEQEVQHHKIPLEAGPSEERQVWEVVSRRRVLVRTLQQLEVLRHSRTMEVQKVHRRNQQEAGGP